MNDIRITAKIEIKDVEHLEKNDRYEEYWFINGFLNEGKQKEKFVFSTDSLAKVEEFKKIIDPSVIYKIDGNLVVKYKKHEFIYVNIVNISDMDGKTILNNI